MFQLFLYITTLQWSPGPLNLMALNNGLQGHVRKTINFCIGIGLGMTLQYILCGYASQFINHPALLPWIAGIGSLYIMWLGYQMIKKPKTKDHSLTSTFNQLSFQDGLLMQLTNPKGFVAALPVATIYFPSLGIDKIQIIFFSVIFGIICVGSVLCYTLLGRYFSKWITQPSILRKCNIFMGILLFFVALSLDLEYIILPLF